MKYIVLNEEYRGTKFGYKEEEGIEESEFLSIREDGELINTDPASGEQFEHGQARENLYEMVDGEWVLSDIDVIFAECEMKEDE